MEIEQIQSELFKAIDSPYGSQSVRHLMLRVKKENSEKVLDALLGIFFESRRSENGYSAQQAAAGLLWKLKPKYKRSLRDDIKRSLQNWDVSVRELPWYFAEATSIETVCNEVKSLLTEPLDYTSRQKAETYLYWLSASDPEEFKIELNQRWNGRLRG